MRIAFAGTPHFAEEQLRALLSTSHEIVVVYTQPDKLAGRGQHLTCSPVKALALANHIPVEQPLHLKSKEAEAVFTRYAPDLMIVAAYGLILPSFFLTLPQYGCINVHASLLPRWRGASPIQQAILAGDQETGITLMKMDEGLDTGAIIIQKGCPILPADTASSLHDKLAALGASMLKEDLDDLINTPATAQDPLLATHAPKITKEQAICHWEKAAIQIERQIRAFQPWPILHTTLEKQLLRLWEAKVVPLHSTELPGTILGHPKEGLLVATGDQGLLITQAQWAGKKVLPMKEILKSRQALLAIGKRFDLP